MNDRVPCSVSIDKLAHDLGEQEFGAEDLKEAREEIIDGIIGNTNGLNGVLLWHVLQSWLNVDGRLYDERLSIVGKHLQMILQGAPMDPAFKITYEERRKSAFAIARYEAEEWLREIVNESVTNEQVEERAAKIAADRLEDASC